MTADEPPVVAQTRRRVICERCGENHRLSKNYKCIAEEILLPSRRNTSSRDYAERGRPTVAANVA